MGVTEQHKQAAQTAQRADTSQEFEEAEDRGPDGPTDLPGRDWKAVAKRTFAEFTDDGGTDLAAALTYYSMMSITPMLLALSSVLGVFGQGGATTQAISDLGGQLGLEQETLTTVTKYVASMQESPGGVVVLIVGILGSLWSASNYVNAFSRMTNTVYEVEEGRPIWKLRPWLLLVTLVLMLMIMAVVLSVSLSGDLSSAIFGLVGLSDQADMIWNIAKWPVILIMLMLMVGLLYWGTPNVQHPKFRWLTPGAALAIIVSIIAAAGFGFYALNFGSYNATYGALGGVIILLLMIWLINTALVLGAELDAELERARELAAGLPAEESIQLPPRDASGTEKKAEKSAELVREARQLRMKAARARNSSDS